MKRRAAKRINANIDVKFYCENTDYSGTVTNLSEKGMYISTNNMCFPFNSEFEILLSVEDDFIALPVRVSRLTKTNGGYNGIGVELSEPSSSYLKFLENLKKKQ